MENLGIDGKLLLAQIINFVLFFILVTKFVVKPFTAFLNPGADIRGTGYHYLQSMIAIGSGEIFGKGNTEKTAEKLLELYASVSTTSSAPRTSPQLP